MFETYRMLGDEREAKLLREAQRLHALPPVQILRSIVPRVLACTTTGPAGPGE
jgi:hypothetical protein